MRNIASLVAALALSACATRPPEPPDCEGDLVPINVPTATATSTAPTADSHEARSGH